MQRTHQQATRHHSVHLTFDQDWATEAATLAVLAVLETHDLRGTFFVTHPCPALHALRASGRVELAWHPNFLPGSSHGATPEAVLSTLAQWVPEAVGARAHCLVQGTPTLMAYRRAGLRYDAATLRDGVADLAPFRSWTGLWDLPIWFEDDVHLERGLPCHLQALSLDAPGLKIMTFHPMLVALDAPSLAPYHALKAGLAGQPLSQAPEALVAQHRGVGGVGSLFHAVAEWMARHREVAGGTLAELVGALSQAAA